MKKHLSHLHRRVKQRLKTTDNHNSSLPDWTTIIKSSRPLWNKPAESRADRRILVATSVGGFAPGLITESTLAAALTMRGANVHAFLCDRVLPACLEMTYNRFPDTAKFVKSGPPVELCRQCFADGRQAYKALGVKLERYSKYLSPKAKNKAKTIASTLPAQEIPGFSLDGLTVGEHALAGALRFCARGTLENEPNGEAILRRYFEAALLTTYATQALLSKNVFDGSVFHHGIYVPQGLIGEVLRQNRVPVSTWAVAYRKQRFIFSHNDTYHHTLLNEPTDSWETLDLTAGQKTDLLSYLRSRWHGTHDWVRFHEKPELKIDAVAKEIGIDFSKPTIGLLTNVVWDAQLHYHANAFANQLDWLLGTIDYFADRPDIQLVIRVHPAEIRGTIPSRQKVVDEIKRERPNLSPNIFVVPPESPISTYTAMQACEAVLIYGTKTGVELTSMGIPVIVGGEAWIRNKGITMDAASPKQYFSFLDRLPISHRLDDPTIKRAQKYAYHFFFRRMIPLSCMEPRTGWPPYQLKLSGLNDLLPGADHGLDVICNGILAGKEFIYPAELYNDDKNREN